MHDKIVKVRQGLCTFYLSKILFYNDDNAINRSFRCSDDCKSLLLRSIETSCYVCPPSNSVKGMFLIDDHSISMVQ
jgi:hypothetical protein